MLRVVCVVTLFLYVLVYFSVAESVSYSSVVAKYPNKYFIEVESGSGDGIQGALQAGFKEIYSIESEVLLYKQCVRRFFSNPHVHVVLGNSYKILPGIIEKIDAPATFWFGGHTSWGKWQSTRSPLVVALQAIHHHPIKNHTILVDSICETKSRNYYDLATLSKKIFESNPHYLFRLEAGYQADDILAAYVP